MAGQHLSKRGHSVTLHARNESRAGDALAALPQAEGVIVGDIETIEGAVAVAHKANGMGRFDAVIHNAAVFSGGARMTEDGLRSIFAVNVLAPFILTSLVTPPHRLVYLSSSMHLGVGVNLDDVQWERRGWAESPAYSESKLHVLLLAFAVARLWPGVNANGVDPGWVPTRMGGSNATDDLLQGCMTQVELAAPEHDSPLAGATGEYFHHMRAHDPDPQSRDSALQDQLLTLCAKVSGIKFPQPVLQPALLKGDQ